ncbi:MAG: GspH/FimT family pseudopilin, partial [Gammaproteobacteria bacterium]|nr:GspH/FimT family pseudopilin [Gammaproteobacteria bacterium]
MAKQRCYPRIEFRGYTLLELLATVTVLGVLLGVGVPNLFSLIEQNRLTTDANNLVVSLNYARSEAIRRNSMVSVCPSADGDDCNSDSWTAGGIVFTDGGTLGTVDGTDTVLKVIPAVSVDI